MFEKALLLNITDSLERLSYVINGDIQSTPTPSLNIELCLNTIQTLTGNIKYVVSSLFGCVNDCKNLLVGFSSIT
jgi:hypothetical protein